MATIVDYLNKHKRYEHNFDMKNFVLELVGDQIFLHVKENVHKINADHGAEDAIMYVLEDKYGFEIRFCKECGIPFDAGYTDECGWEYFCEDCFDDDYRDRVYGKGRWKCTDHAGENGGYYAYLNNAGEWEDTGIFYTEWF